jgi:hypothetical protein
MQMSRRQVFTFVEGKEADGFFVGGLCKRAFALTNHSYQVSTAAELSYKGGGKDVLIRFYHYLRSRRCLDTTLNGKRTHVLFFLDKDVDDLTRARCRSKNVLYTTFYDVENHLFRAGDFVRSVASACSVPQDAVRAHPRFGTGWCSDASHRWRVWATLCVFCQLHRIGYPNYRVLSQVNTPKNGGLDRAKYRQTLRDIYRKTGWTWPEFASMLKAARSTVDKLYASGEADRVFKGKWYAQLLELDLREDEQFRNAQIDGIAKRMPSCLATTLDFHEDWASTFVDALRRVVD